MEFAVNGLVNAEKGGYYSKVSHCTWKWLQEKLLTIIIQNILSNKLVYISFDTQGLNKLSVNIMKKKTDRISLYSRKHKFALRFGISAKMSNKFRQLQHSLCIAVVMTRGSRSEHQELSQPDEYEIQIDKL